MANDHIKEGGELQLLDSIRVAKAKVARIATLSSKICRIA
jgi:hypothetical protein